MRQLILNIPPSDQYKIEDFIISSSNKQVYDKLINLQTNWGVEPYKYSILISGPNSCGKSFLAKIFENIANAHLITAEFSADIIASYYPAFIIEDIENWQEEKLLHYFNVINETQKYLLLTSSNQNYTPDLLDLRSRINAILKIEVQPPDQELMRMLLVKIFSSHSIKLDTKVLKFLSNRLPRRFDEIIKAAEKIITYSMIQKKRITISLIKEALPNSI